MTSNVPRIIKETRHSTAQIETVSDEETSLSQSRCTEARLHWVFYQNRPELKGLSYIHQAINTQNHFTRRML